MKSKAELAEAARELFRELIAGDDPEDVADIMGWDEETFAKVKAQMLNTKAEEARAKPPDHAYVEYLIEQKRNISDVTNLIKTFDKKTNAHVHLGAIKLRSELQERILERGFDFGILKKAGGPASLGSGNTFIVGGQDVNIMPMSQLRDVIGAQLNELSTLITKHGDGKSITELTPGNLHYGDVVEAEAASTPDE